MDLHISDNGDLAVGEGGDLAVDARRYGPLLQELFVRVKTELGDFTPYPWLGTELSKLWGLPNTKSTGSKGVDALYKAITFDGKLSRASVNINAVPQSAHEIRFDVDIRFNRQETYLITLQHKLSQIGAS